MRAALRLLIRLLCMLLLAASPVVGFYGWFAWEASQEAALQKDPELHNSIKHAYAAGEVYLLLRVVGIAPEKAQSLALDLGKFSERAEYRSRQVKRRDPTREIMKDLYNNAAGVMLYRACEEHHAPRSLRRRWIGQVVKQGVMPKHYTDTRIPSVLPDKPSNPEGAIRWFEKEQASLQKQIRANLDPVLPCR